MCFDQDVEFWCRGFYLHQIFLLVLSVIVLHVCIICWTCFWNYSVGSLFECIISFTGIKVSIFCFSVTLVQSVPLATESGNSLIISPLMRILQRNLKWTLTSLCKKCDDIITYAGSGHHLRPDRIELGAPYFGKSLPVRPLSLPEFLRWSLLSRRLWLVVCFDCAVNKT